MTGSQPTAKGQEPAFCISPATDVGKRVALEWAIQQLHDITAEGGQWSTQESDATTHDLYFIPTLHQVFHGLISLL